MRNRIASPLLIVLTVLSLIAAACGSTAEVSTGAAGGTESTESPDTTAAEVDPSIDISARLTEQDLAEARMVFDAAKARWDALEPFAYTLTVGFESVNELAFEFDADGNLVGESVVFGEPDDFEPNYLPESVAEAFDLVEETIMQFETGEREVPPNGECGNHFNAEFDSELGAPSYFDTLGPCDDGVGVGMTITPT